MVRLSLADLPTTLSIEMTSSSLTMMGDDSKVCRKFLMSGDASTTRSFPVLWTIYFLTFFRERKEMLRYYSHNHHIQNCPEEDHYPRWIRVDCCQSEFLDFWSAVRFRGDVEGKSEFCQMGFYHDGGKRCNLPYMYLGSCTDTCLKTNPNFWASCILNDNLLGVSAKVVLSWTRLYREFSFPCIRNQLIYLQLRLGKFRKRAEE